MWPASRSPARFIVALALSLLVILVTASAQPPVPLARIAFRGLPPAPPASALPPVVAAFQQHLRELGWVEGQHLTIEWRWAEGSLERFATLVDEMVRLHVEVMLVPNQITAQVAQQATTTIPIIMAGGGAIAHTVPSIARPGGNVTGFAGLGPELSTKRLELLTQAIPGLTRVAVLRGLAPQTLELQAMEVAARALGVQLQLLEARDPTEIDRAFAAALSAGAGALVVFADGGLLLHHRAHLKGCAWTKATTTTKYASCWPSLGLHRPHPGARGRGQGAQTGGWFQSAAVGGRAHASLDESFPAHPDPLGQEGTQLSGLSACGLCLHHL